MTFGERLTQLRKEHGYTTRNEFAEKLKIPSTTLRNYETDVREPGHTFLKQISEMFNVSVDYLLCLTDEKEVLNNFRLRAPEQEIVEKYRDLDDHGKDMVNMVLKEEHKRWQKENTPPQTVAEKTTAFPQPAAKAAHARTDIEHTPEGKAHDDALMENDEYWK